MITLSALAKLAHVSISTASKAFSGSREVNEQTREAIFSLAKEHGVFKKFYNAKYPKLVIAALVPEFHSGHYSLLLSQLQKCLHDKGCTMTVTACDFLSEEIDRAYDYYSHYTDVDGVIVVDNGAFFPKEMPGPTVWIGSAAEMAVTPKITIDGRAAVKTALSYLKSKGVTKVGYIAEDKTRGKLQMFQEVMEEVYGAYEPKYTVITEGRFEEAGYAGMKRLIEENRLPRAVLCGYDEIAMGAMRCLADHGLSVPKDVALIGYNENHGARYAVPSLSTIDIQHEKCAALAVDVILNEIFSKPIEGSLRVEAVFCPRESSEIQD
ncbi:MAG: LacI family DNA-binding transcriptional regulator [Clostridia bacterium]|nr:LacI family DNA-binding transcriptional regulator [Clostridia bacterium]MBO7171273.1 LacI family DNA-binding transcriptional regulator [Clostridia bacterium]